MFACLHWISANAKPVQINGQPYMPPDGLVPNGDAAAADTPATAHPAETQLSSGANGVDSTSSAPLTTESSSAARDFQATLKELAQDLVIKEQQIEALIKDLPGLNRSQDDQERRMQELEEEAKSLEDQARELSKVREGLIRRVEETMMKVKRV